MGSVQSGAHSPVINFKEEGQAFRHPISLANARNHPKDWSFPLVLPHGVALQERYPQTPNQYLNHTLAAFHSVGHTQQHPVSQERPVGCCQPEVRVDVSL